MCMCVSPGPPHSYIPDEGALGGEGGEPEGRLVLADVFVSEKKDADHCLALVGRDLVTSDHLVHHPAGDAWQVPLLQVQ